MRLLRQMFNLKNRNISFFISLVVCLVIPKITEEAMKLDIEPLEKEQKNKLPEICGVSYGIQKRSGQKSNLKLVGNDAVSKKFPWAIRVYARESETSNDENKWCNGVLISQQHVLTAAHCLFISGGAKVFNEAFVLVADISEEAAFRISDTRNRHRYKITGIKFHPCYKINDPINHDRSLDSHIYYDVVIAQLSRPLNLRLVNDKSAVPACLPTSNEAEEENEIVFPVFNRDGWKTGLLQWAKMMKTECQNPFQQFSWNPYYESACYKPQNKLYQSQLGDFGGGLVEKDASGRWYVIGILFNDVKNTWIQSWWSGRTGFYIPLFHILSWINGELQIDNENLRT